MNVFFQIVFHPETNQFKMVIQDEIINLSVDEFKQFVVAFDDLSDKSVDFGVFSISFQKEDNENVELSVSENKVRFIRWSLPYASLSRMKEYVELVLDSYNSSKER